MGAASSVLGGGSGSGRAGPGGRDPWGGRLPRGPWGGRLCSRRAAAAGAGTGPQQLQYCGSRIKQLHRYAVVSPQSQVHVGCGQSGVKSCDFLGAFRGVFLCSRTFGEGSRGGTADEAVVPKTLSGSSGNRGEPDAARVEAAAGTVPSWSAVMGGRVVFSHNSRTF